MAAIDGFVGIGGALSIPSFSALTSLSNRDWALHPVLSMAGGEAPNCIRAIVQRAHFVIWASHWQPRYFPKVPRFSLQAPRLSSGPAGAIVTSSACGPASRRRSSPTRLSVGIAAGALAVLTWLMSLRPVGREPENILTGATELPVTAKQVVSNQKLQQSAEEQSVRAKYGEDSRRSTAGFSDRVRPRVSAHLSIHRESSRALRRSRFSPNNIEPEREHAARVEEVPAMLAGEVIVAKLGNATSRFHVAEPSRSVQADIDWMQHMEQRRLTDDPGAFSK
ncbi:hypothetical protein [Burkholderia sp. BCC1972]|uniref:hypothetical protein n=1 Tax=Burkholderia sp. BCC1972 TaxID=2817438 RepID=UPI002ABDD808|nr:hypothetical protein [Burkholderia sp. BCC1972]